MQQRVFGSHDCPSPRPRPGAGGFAIPVRLQLLSRFSLAVHRHRAVRIVDFLRDRNQPIDHGSKIKSNIAICISRLLPINPYTFKLCSATEAPSFQPTTPPAWSRIQVAVVVVVLPPPSRRAPFAGAHCPGAGIKPIKQTEPLFHMNQSQKNRVHASLHSSETTQKRMEVLLPWR